MKHLPTLLVILASIFSCTPPMDQGVDMILVNGNVITMDTKLAKAEAIAIKDGRIQEVGDNEKIKALAGENTETLDLEGQTAIPGFIEGHGHFSGLGYSLIRLNLMKTKNWDEIVELVAERVKTAQPGEWIEGRGWHQEKWDKEPSEVVEGYPTHEQLSAISPDNPIILRHASGHSAFANAKAMELTGITVETPAPKGGRIVRETSGEAIGVFEERAMDVLYEALKEYRNTLSPEARKQEWLKAIGFAQKECLENGVTSFQDAGSPYKEIDDYHNLAKNGELDIRLWVMIRQPYEETKVRIGEFPLLNAGNNHFTVRSVKSQVDGALGAHGAWLLADYDDKPNFLGQNTTSTEEVANMAKLCMEQNLQLCVHAIGDRANREVLDIFEKSFKSNPDKKDLRWRIEHAQHVNMKDIPRFAALDVIASMQGIHCTSDAPFVEKRLGERRAKEESYAWRTILDSGARIANGTDTPVEDISPIENFYASVTRKRQDGMEFFPEQRMTREEALHSYTLANAFAAFEEKDKGSLTKGKLADITVLSKDLLTIPDEEILDTEVIYTIVGGIIKYKNKK